ncbi:MAG TPA: HAMP domain-containing sensor histidine kinase [Nocardioides sp.]|uniref:sensor histidine kinase n=1 Tax=uncultured Nocardioides sp. TaxID=198441 RepID=UPI00260B011C|nr:HAMP domain-containing sensor histidine kinase [uncultured Nocardioides sp.]HRI96094.1 HAMP domain-containing sensor histidine kinase [Nocardioides sp.]HRK46088.1 HAMP domain-containing sensor histidine kinase [Nocardioides sp.]
MDDQRGESATRAPEEAGGRRRFAPRSFRGKIVLSTVALMTLAMVVVGFGIQLVLGIAAQRDITQVLDDRSEATITIIQQASKAELTVPPDTLEPGEQVYDSDGTLVAGSIEHDVRDAAADLATTDTVRTVQGPSDEERLLGTPFTTPSGDSGVLVVSQETGPYERSEFYALLATVLLGLLVIAATALMALRVTRQALEPVTQMAERASEWSEYDLTHRFDLGPPTNELAALGETLDHLLDRVASAIRSEQRLTSELAHELRTPLTAIQGSADLALLRGVDDPATRADLEQIAASAREMSGVIATLLDIARDGSAAARDQTCRIADVMPALVNGAGDLVTVEDRTDGSMARIAAPTELVARAVSPIVDNAVRHARTRITFEASDHQDRVELVVADDGEGVASAVREQLFQPGVTNGSGGAGLGLGIARRVARSFGGEIDLLDAGPEGAAFRVTLPRR